MMGMTGKSSIECNILIVHLISVMNFMLIHIYLNILQIDFVLSWMIISEHLTFSVRFRQGFSDLEKCTLPPSWRHKRESWTSYIIHTVDYLQDFFTWGCIQNNTCGWWHQVSRAQKLSRPHFSTLRVNDRVQKECSVMQNLILLWSGQPQSVNWHWLCRRKYSPFKTTQKFQYLVLKIDNYSKLSLVN
jgi:hypothetical protein